MAGTVYVAGGFGSAGLADASDSLRARIAAADAEHERQAAREAAERRVRAERLAESNIAASVRMAEERGELLTMRERMEGVGRTPSEAIAFYSAVADVEDRKRAAKLERQFREWRQRENDAASADMTPPSEIDLAELQVMQQRAQRFREREYDRQLTRRQVAADRAAERAAARRRWGF